MNKKTLIFFLCLTIFAFSLHAQQDCSNIIFKVEESMRKGHLNDAKLLLSDECIETIVKHDDKEHAYYLRVLINLYLKDLDSAKESMLKLLKHSPEFVCKSNYPVQFLKFYDTFKVRASWVIGARGGINFSQIQPTLVFSLDNLNENNGIYRSSLGFQVYGVLMKPINNRIDIGAELGYKRFSYRYERQNFAYSNLKFTENQNIIEVPLFVRFNIGNNYNFYKNRSKFLNCLNPYFLAGTHVNFLLSSTATINREDILITNEAASLNSQPISITNMRERVNYHLMVGAGVEYKRHRGIFSVEFRYVHGLNNAIKQNMRYSNQDLIFGYGYIDNDIKFNNWILSFGYNLPIYRHKQIKPYIFEEKRK